MSERNSAVSDFAGFVKAAEFPCVGAKSAYATSSLVLVEAGDLKSSAHDTTLLSSLQAFASQPRSQLASVVALFPQTERLSEVDFEVALWQRLGALVEADRHHFAPDPTVSDDPDAPDFAVSFGGAGFFVVGMHPGASRLARRAPMAALAFNLHAQFRALKDAGGFDRMSEIVRRRDIALQGSTNPMLADHGDRSEAIQYSGRTVSEAWVCPFKAHRDAA